MMSTMSVGPSVAAGNNAQLGAPGVPASRSNARRVGTPLAVYAVYTMWVLELFKPQWWIASFGLGFMRQIPNLLWPVLLLLVVTRAKPKHFYWPLGLLLVAHLMGLIEPVNLGRQIDPTKRVFWYCVLVVASLAAINTVSRAVPLVLMFILQFGWWMVHSFPGLWMIVNGVPGTMVPWDPYLGNEDGFSVIAVMGIGFSYFTAQAVRSQKLRWVAMVIGVLCVVTLVPTFARGAILSAGVVLIAIILRSRHRIRSFAALIGLVSVFLVAQHLMFPGGDVFSELATTTEGVNQGTSKDRWDLWRAAIKVYQRYPLSGAGPGGFGPAAAATLEPGELELSRYSDPSRIWGRVTHNVYLQVLSELGTVGALAFIAIIVGFFRRNMKLRRAWAIAVWAQETQGRIDLRAFSIALDMAMLGYLCTGLFYDQLYIPWFFVLVILNLVLVSVVERGHSLNARIRESYPASGN